MRLLFVLVALLALSGCSWVGAHISASPDVNLDKAGQPQPIILRVFYLTEPGRFEQATSQSLFDQPGKALGNTLISVSQIALAPGASLWWHDAWPSNTKYVGFAADYRELWHLPWRQVMSVNFLAKNIGGELQIKLTKKGLHVKELW